MPAPHISNFGDEDHPVGSTNLVIDGFSFAFFEGEVWMFAAADRSGLSDQLTLTLWSDMRIAGVAIPASPNNAEGAVFLAVQRFGDLAWSNSYAFTLAAAAGPVTGIPHVVGRMVNVGRMMYRS